MDESADGIIDEKGHWRPVTPCEYSPLFTTPWKLKAVFKWFGRFYDGEGPYKTKK